MLFTVSSLHLSVISLILIHPDTLMIIQRVIVTLGAVQSIKVELSRLFDNAINFIPFWLTAMEPVSSK